ncbi:gamma-aminobutyric acid receptor subunit alpha-6-like [Mizuhopecten yessoensis]|uniref:Gamma-aminobutyric acid receptor subunit alpha-6 n=1 Tax=Mizuhopecten yessoensis TaxID=6573 RepID=A0A210QUI0_MIZYE|nr:gamma-aminobutyric acid receptor subunit alpha-6-like [Mizuhopecten yessoensis]OWF52389.1 Gamma-aminobutyric acid receptor subunit alpha-6 [Mizuhopecten yessoensis]
MFTLNTRDDKKDSHGNKIRMMSPRLLLYSILSVLSLPGNVYSLTPLQRDEVENMLQKDHSTPPFYHTGNRTVIRISIYMTEMRFLKRTEADFTFYYYQIWDDPRLKYPFANTTDFGLKDYHVVRRKYFDNIWLAESYIENELHSRVHDSSMSNRFVWLLSNGTLVYSMRMTAGLVCNLRGVLFPNALFVCRLKFRIHSYTKEKVSLEWDTLQKPIIPMDFDNEDVSMDKWELLHCTLDDSAVVDSSCLELKLGVKVGFASNAVRIFMPSIFIVLVGWLSFWIERSEVSARIKLGTLSMIAMITEQVGAKFFLPVDFKVTAFEVWYIMSLVFVVAAMFEYTFVHAVDVFQLKVKRQEDQRKEIREVSGSDVDTNGDSRVGSTDQIEMDKIDSVGPINDQSISTEDNNDLMNTCCARYIMMISTGRVEKYFRILYAIAYLVFQFFFWTISLNYEETNI